MFCKLVYILLDAVIRTTNPIPGSIWMPISWRCTFFANIESVFLSSYKELKDGDKEIVPITAALSTADIIASRKRGI